VFTDDREALLDRVKNEFSNNKIAIHAVTGEVTLTEHFDRYRKENAEQQEKKQDAKQNKKQGKQQNSYAQYQVDTIQEKRHDQQQIDDSLQKYDRYTRQMPINHEQTMCDYDQYMADLKEDFDVSASTYYAVKHHEDKAKSSKNSKSGKKDKNDKNDKTNESNQSNNYANTVFSEKVY
ncbi:hypothetical protein, partial [Cysteiniphilum litorale]|uniref:hypothetical protein n=1 Tax=Cysteiniphilum litorale TaxID=2056700 RepID=UPI003F883A53